MAKFRTNHARNSSSGGGGMMVKVGIFSALVAGLYYIFQLFSGESPTVSDAPASGVRDKPAQTENRIAEDYLPRGSRGQVIAYSRYYLSYNESHEQADWVAYVLSRDDLAGEMNPREDNFLPDPRVKTGSATPDDYRGSGYDRGHLVPAADMAYDAHALAETFFMSNISPQARDFNQGVWRELEELTRNWARRFEELYIVSGPVLSRKPKGAIGRENEVSVPIAYYKVLLDASEPEQKGIAFIIPNEVSFEPLTRYAVSIDEAEAQTGFDFFPEVMPDAVEKQLEGQFNIDLWPFSKQKYDLRVNKWNNVNN